MSKLRKYRRHLLELIDIAIIIVSYIGLQIFIRDTFQLSEEVIKQLQTTIIIAIITYILIFVVFRLYRNITRYESGKDYLIYVLACTLSSLCVSVIGILFNLNILNAKHNLVTSFIISMGVIGYRIILRIILTNEKPINKEEKPKKLLIIGAGSATRDIIKSITTTMKNTYNIVGIIDDNKEKIGRVISGIEVLGDRSKIVSICKREKVETIFF